MPEASLKAILSKGIFAFNQGLDKAIFKPLAKGYRTLPSPIRTGVGNSLNNLSNLTTIPNNILQGELNYIDNLVNPDLE